MRGWWLEPDHIIPQSRWTALGGGDGLHEPPNLAAACTPCNRSKRDHVDGLDPLTGQLLPLYNPRDPDRAWSDHFTFSPDFDLIIPTSSIRRATEYRLRMNRPLFREQRRLLRLANLAGGFDWP